MSARHDLAAVVWHRKLPYGGLAGLHISLDANAAHAVAELVLAAGYRKPRTITEWEDAAVVGTVALAADGEVLMKSDDFAMDGIRPLWWRCAKGMSLTTLEPIHLPATVLHEGVTK